MLLSNSLTAGPGRPGRPPPGPGPPTPRPPLSRVRRAVADQRRALDRGRHLAVLDQVGLRRAEHELARGDVHLAAAEAHRVQAMAHAGEDLARIALAGAHI